MLTVSRLVCATMAMLGFTTVVTAYVNPGVNLGAGDSFAAAFLTAIDFVEPNALLQNARNPELAYNLGLLREIADQAMVAGPYTVTNVSLPYGLPPNGDVHSYYSWAPYWWPEDTCAFLNTTDYMTKCKYTQRDGEFNPDLYYIRQKPAFNNVAADSVSLALAAEAFGEWDYLSHAAMELRHFFLNEETFMRPNFDFTQIRRGSNNKPVGVKSGVLDARWLMYVTTTLNILNAHIDEILPGQTEAVWTTADYQGMQSWMTNMTTWMMTATIAKDAGKTTNNHATWYFAQASTYAYFGGDNVETARILKQFLNGIYQTFFSADGGQPKELERTRPFHYSVFNLEPLVCMAKLGEKVGVDVWGWPSKAGNTTIQKAVDFLLDLGSGDEEPFDLLQHIYAVRGRYGDPTGKYAYWIANFTAGMENPPIYPLWAYPLYTPPTSSATFSPALNAAGWTQQDAVVVMVAQDGASQSGIAQLNVTVDGVLSEIMYETRESVQTRTVVLSSEGVHTVSYCAENGQGDKEVCGDDHTVTVSIDKTAPVVAFVDVNSRSLHYDIADVIAIDCQVTDAVSGVASATCNDFSTEAVNMPLAPATTALSAQAVDHAGNTASVQAQVTVTASFNGLCNVTRRFMPFNTFAATTMCNHLSTASRSSSRLVRNLALDAYMLEARTMILGRLTREQGQVLINAAKSLKA